MRFPDFESYADTKGRNYGLNSLRFLDGDGNVFWFSYSTLVAFKTVAGQKVVRENEWGPTTGKHLNIIDDGDKKNRVSGDEFERLYAEAFDPCATGTCDIDGHPMNQGHVARKDGEG